MKLSECINTSA